jgi:hypothetical protein
MLITAAGIVWGACRVSGARIGPEPMTIRPDSGFEPHLILEYTDSGYDFAVFASMQSAWRQGIEMRLGRGYTPSVYGSDQ